mmetsp:Transcript_4022/g.4113  ORF Transcript_4022/g.4113 Transcript_4022/m.4113 type:complete len:283 (-) Transcript_4022:25-873(-)|eukprot:CAMPEP_0182418576 /NCGR_PEP_ID=MMETSP1167-20130531/2970_1 /TAXON_ID=2988 /ORGANISM="Mallomonas Sp, Strain CCMP3275" /LENGTH=282 /DNA_ID=CAMNT_0024592843 /DNA_START=151 /DNA_END=999 /DNA_ORIENTATION=+
MEKQSLSKKAGHSKDKVVKKELNISSASQSLWLVKVPQQVFDNWSTKSHNEVLGTLSITSSAPSNAGPSDKKIVINLTNDSNASESSECLTDYVLNELSGGVELTPFVQNEETGAFAVKGKVTKQFTLKPKGDNKYRELCRNRTVNALKRPRIAQAVDGNEANDAQSKIGIMDFIPPGYVDMKRKATEQKNLNVIKRVKGVVIGDTKDLRNKMFQAFENKEHLTLKEISLACQAPEKDVKEIVREYAIFHVKGIYRNYWELKPEYRVISHETSTDLKSSPEH